MQRLEVSGATTIVVIRRQRVNMDLVFVCFMYRNYYPCRKFQCLIAGTSGKCIFKLSTKRLDGLSSDTFLFPIPHLQTKGDVSMCLIQYRNTANLGSSTSENYAVKNLTLGKHSHMG